MELEYEVNRLLLHSGFRPLPFLQIKVSSKKESIWKKNVNTLGVRIETF